MSLSSVSMFGFKRLWICIWLSLRNLGSLFIQFGHSQPLQKAQVGFPSISIKFSGILADGKRTGYLYLLDSLLYRCTSKDGHFSKDLMRRALATKELAGC